MVITTVKVRYKLHVRIKCPGRSLLTIIPYMIISDSDTLTEVQATGDTQNNDDHNNKGKI